MLLPFVFVCVCVFERETYRFDHLFLFPSSHSIVMARGLRSKVSDSIALFLFHLDICYWDTHICICIYMYLIDSFLDWKDRMIVLCFVLFLFPVVGHRMDSSGFSRSVYSNSDSIGRDSLRSNVMKRTEPMFMVSFFFLILIIFLFILFLSLSVCMMPFEDYHSLPQ